MFLMMPSTKIAQMVFSTEKGAARVLDKKYLQMTFPPEPLVQIQNNLTEIFLMSSTKIDQNIQLG